MLKAVVHLGDGTLVKGFYNDSEEKVRGCLGSGGGYSLPSEIQLHPIGGGTATVDLNRAKALFFVESFDGKPEYNEVKFFKARPELAGLWVRMRFADGEVTEGVVHNSISFLISPGFFVKPPDPLSNNRLIYALKKSLVDFQILAIRNEY
ncbi:MAG TPA: hypothetical protein VKZ53_26440 [Candidatus Angelobacter sp.]|nr:hypothetical protein [Candidatus Angelobacter sp.]